MRKLLDKEYIQERLINLGNVLILPKYRDSWSSDNPTAGYCYIVSEVIYHYTDLDVKPYSMVVENGTHWFLKDENNNVIDLTSSQFEYELDYCKCRKKEFYKGIHKTNKGLISDRGYKLAKYLELA